MKNISQPILSLRNIQGRFSITYPDIDIYQDKTTIIQGESGSGKSTLFQICNGTLTPTRGDLFYNGKNIKEQDPLEVRKDILVASQKVFLFPESIEENFKKFYAYRDEECISLEKMQEYLELCKIQKPLNSLCSELSGGEKQRVFISICISFMPKILLLDEPTAALDEANTLSLMTNICHFTKQHNIALMVISHNPQISRFADQEIFLAT